MFLRNLREEQKDLALDLLIHASYANNQMDEAEHFLIEQYCTEMGIEARFSAKMEKDAAMKLFEKKADKETMRMMLVELTALVMSDTQIDSREQAFIDEFAALGKVSKNEYKEIRYLLEDITEDYQRLDRIVHSFH